MRKVLVSQPSSPYEGGFLQERISRHKQLAVRSPEHGPRAIVGLLHLKEGFMQELYQKIDKINKETSILHLGCIVPDCIFALGSSIL